MKYPQWFIDYKTDALEYIGCNVHEIVDMARNYEAIFNQGLVRLQQLIPEDALPNYYEESPNDSYRTGRI